jgi:hypothetical protein
MLSFATVVAVTFTVAELMLMSNRKVVFTTFNTPTISDRWPAALGQSLPVTESSLVVYFGSDRILVGSLASLTAPAPGSALIMLPRDSWRQSIDRSVLESDSFRSIFPVSSVGIALSGSEGHQGGFSEVLGLMHAVRRLNARFGGHETDPVATYFVDISGGLVGVN